jgi:hypothetical protein
MGGCLEVSAPSCFSKLTSLSSPCGQEGWEKRAGVTRASSLKSLVVRNYKHNLPSVKSTLGVRNDGGPEHGIKAFASEVPRVALPCAVDNQPSATDGRKLKAVLPELLPKLHPSEVTSQGVEELSG